MDAASGFDFVAYHRSAPNRRYELRIEDVQTLCREDAQTAPPCFIEDHRDADWKEAAKESFRGCACFFVKSFP